MTSTRRDLLAVAACLAIVVGGLIWWFANSGLLSGIAGHSYEVNAMVPQAGSLSAGSKVRIAGVDVGRVTAVKRRQNGALVRFAVDEDERPLADNTRVTVRLRTLVGENYVQLHPGRGREMLPDGGVLPMSQADEYVEADQVLSLLKGKTRDRARATIRGLAGAVGGRGDALNRTLEQGTGLLDAAVPVSDVLMRDRRKVARLVDGLGTLTAAVGQRGAAIRDFAHAGRVTFRSIADRDDAVRGTLEALPSTLRQVRLTSGVLQRVNATSTPVLAGLARTVRALRPTVGLLRPAAQNGREVVRELGKAAPPLTSTLTRLEKLSGPAVEAVPRIGEVLCQANPALDHLAPYARDISVFLQDLGTATNYYDATGHAARLQPTVGFDEPTIYGEDVNRAISALLKTGVIGKAVRLGYNPHPAAGQAGETAGPDSADGPSSVRSRYPRVAAAC